MINRDILSQEEIDALLKQFFKEADHQAPETQDSTGAQSVQKIRHKRKKGFEEE